MNLRKIQILSSIAIIILFLVTCTAYAESSSDTAKTITDMAGRDVPIPETVNSVLGTNQASVTMIYILSPDKLSGFSSDSSKSKYLPDKYKNLPNVGGTQGKTKLNAESFQSMHPDIMFMAYTPGQENDVEDTQRQLNPIPVVALAKTTDINNFAEPLRFLGKILGSSDKAEEFIKFYQDIYKKVNQTTSAIPESERKRVYYAEGTDGLLTDPVGVGHSQPLEVSNGINVANVQFNGGIGRTPVSFEQILAWNPEVIIAFDQNFYNTVYSDPKWNQIKAVQDKQVYLVPSDPFNWYDRSPGVNIVMGIPWTAKVLYPDKFKDMDLKSLTKEFYSKFYHYDLTDDEADTILKGSGLSDY
jgi:iron complex transport system substrate-binding protein